MAKLKAVPAIPATKTASHRNAPPPPKGVSLEARRLWRTLSTDYQIEDSAGLCVLEVVVRSFDRAFSARKLIEVEGELIFDRFRQRKPHPALAMERDARLVMMKALKELHLDLEPLGPLGRPPNNSGK